MAGRIGRLRSQLPQQFRGKSIFTSLHCPLSLMAPERRSNRMFFTGHTIKRSWGFAPSFSVQVSFGEPGAPFWFRLDFIEDVLIKSPHAKRTRSQDLCPMETPEQPDSPNSYP